jgi:D-alanyl-D-alanine carboxypeptidase/D-alanyl-D-alanine-endopeptidase (penicillin-binding protein 4)
MNIRVVFLVGLIFINFHCVLAQNNKVQAALDIFAEELSNEGAAISFKAVNLESTNIVAQYNKDMKLPTASIMKLFTTSLAFEVLGKYYRPKTRFYIDGTIDSLGVLHGDLWIRGAGDPSLGSRYFNKRGDERTFLYEIVDSLLAQGINKINGNVIADGSAFGYSGASEGWTWGDMGNYYGAGPSGCTLFDNTTYFDFATSSELNDSTTISCFNPHIEGLKVYNTVTTAKSQKDNAYIFGAPYSYNRSASGTLPFGKSSFKVKASIPDPELLLAQEITYELNQKIEVVGKPIGFRQLANNHVQIPDYEKKSLIYAHPGKVLLTIADLVNMRSVNLFAEHLLCWIGLNRTGSGSTASGALYAMNYWRNKLDQTVFISDGSGLSRKNAASASDFCELLKYMEKSKNYETLKSTLPIAGKTGTLAGVCRGQSGSGRIYAKSGTMSRIKAYSGYVFSSSGRKLAFCIIVNNHSIPNYRLVKKMEKIFNVMATY